MGSAKTRGQSGHARLRGRGVLAGVARDAGAISDTPSMRRIASIRSLGMRRRATRARRARRGDRRPAYNHDGLTTMATIPDGLGLRQRAPVSARARAVEVPPNLRRYAETGEALIAEPFRGIRADGAVTPDLFPIQATGVSTRALLDAATAFLDSLHLTQRSRALFDVDSDVWRRWSNIHPFVMRHGVALDELTPTQRERALALLRESLSVGGFRTARDV